jgi:hypothetical protein
MSPAAFRFRSAGVAGARVCRATTVRGGQPATGNFSVGLGEPYQVDRVPFVDDGAGGSTRPIPGECARRLTVRYSMGFQGPSPTRCSEA